MPTFVYIGEDATGNEVKNTVEADDRFTVYDIARENGHTVSSVDEASGFSLSGLIKIDQLNYFLSRVKDDELVMMTRNLGSMLKAGLPLSRCLTVIERQTKNLRLKKIMKNLQASINKGDQFDEALREYPETFDNLYVAMVKAGEESGSLSDVLDILSIQMQRSSSLKKKIKGAMIYPAIVLIIMVGIGFLMMIYVMPTLVSVFEGMGSELPKTTQTLIDVSNFVNNYTLVSIGIILGFFVGTYYSLKSKYGKIASAWLIVRLPVIGNIAKEVNAARTSRTLASLLSSGVDVLRSISITEEVVQNHFYKKVLAEAAVRVEKGSPLSEVFTENEKLYPVLVGEMILVGEETGNISNMLKELAEFYETEVERKTKDLSTIIEPLLMVVIGGTVGFFALAVIGPIYSISDSI
ncbi:type II secretion system F family protein [Candidatus Kaiserbacteria bacterium]|nr:type II secretion system F family protein [Candidatus Kaiserbacteria bacterium]